MNKVSLKEWQEVKQMRMETIAEVLASLPVRPSRDEVSWSMHSLLKENGIDAHTLLRIVDKRLVEKGLNLRKWKEGVELDLEGEENFGEEL